MTINRFCLFSILVACFLWTSSVLADEATTLTVNTDNLQELVSTLENEAKRTEFVETLKTIIKVQEEQQAEKDAKALAELTAIEQATEELKVGYQGFLAKMGLDSSLFGRFVAMAGILVVAGFAVYGWRRFYAFAQRKTLAFQERYHLHQRRLITYLRWVRLIGYWLIFLTVLYGFAFTWDIQIIEYFVGEERWLGFLSVSSKILMVVAVGFLIWEMANGIAEYVLFRADMNGQGTRMKTMLPVIRSLLTLVVGIIFLIILLAEIGVNVMPLLAGAGVVGIAVGFGAQKMVTDFLTGITILMEDLIQVGDVATVAGKSGTVEKITTRKIQLRDARGTVVTIPFSEVSTVENQTKDFSNYVMDIAVSYREDADKVIDILRNVGNDMVEDKEFNSLIMRPVDVLGVDKITDGGNVIIKVSIRTRPSQQWKVGREFNRRMKQAFEINEVDVPQAQTNVYIYDQSGALVSATTPPIKNK